MRKMFLTLIFVLISFNFNWAEEVTDYEKWELTMAYIISAVTK